MSVIVQCPNCQETTPFHRTPVERCPRCQTAFPNAVSATAENALRHDLAPKPALLVVGQIVSIFAGAVFLLFLLLATFNVGSYAINEQPVSGHDFLAGGGSTFALIGGWLVAIAFGLWRNRPWARPLMLAYWPVTFGVVIALSWREADLVADAVSSLVFGGSAIAIAGWYLYRKENVVAYFDACTKEE